MPGQIISGILAQVQQDYGRPVVDLFYDGTGDLNREIGVFLRNLPNNGGPPLAHEEVERSKILPVVD
jgi:hypothetical protein